MDNEQLENTIKAIPMYKVESSNINYLGYDNNNKILKVIFKNNSAYAYFGVPEIIWQEIIKSESKGSYLTENVIRQKEQYKFIKLR